MDDKGYGGFYVTVEKRAKYEKTSDVTIKTDEKHSGLVESHSALVVKT